jgi:transcriptional regulator with XRE-family HTH domain
MTQKQFADRCRISVSFASLLERGERSPSYDTLVTIADALRVAPADLFRDGEESDGTPASPPDRLREFAADARLSAAQVERLMAVARAMFELPSPAPELSVATCAEPQCDRPVLARGLCSTHYHRARRARGGEP